MANYFIAAFKWRFLLNSQQISYNYLYLLKITWIGSFYNQFLPGRIGGDAVKVMYLLSDNNISKEKATVSIFIDRIYNLLGLFVLVLVGYYLSLSSEVLQTKLIVELILLLTIVFILVCAFLKILKNRISSQNKILKKIQKYANYFSEYFEMNVQSILLLFYALLYDFVVILTIFLLAISLGVEIDLIEYIFYVPLIFFITLLPISFGGLGIREGGFVYFFSIFSVSNEIAVSVSLLLYFSVMLSSLPGFFLQFKSIKTH